MQIKWAKMDDLAFPKFELVTLHHHEVDTEFSSIALSANKDLNFRPQVILVYTLNIYR